MPFSVAQRTLEQLDWPEVASRLVAHAATPGGRARCAGDLFESSPEEARERLAETGEARGVLEVGDAPPLGGVADLGGPLQRLARGGVLAAGELLDLRATLGALHATARFLRRRRASLPRLADLADTIADLGALEDAIEDALDEEGEVRDTASPLLARARAAARTHAAELQKRLEAYLRDPGVVDHLSDRYVTVRNDRYVLPVRAESRGRVRGIVHDASGSGTTLFVEPEAAVELNNRLRQAELEVRRETLRVLRELSERAAESRPELEASLAALEAIDLAFARGHLALDMDATAPEVAREGVFRLPQLRHPLLEPDAVIPNDLRLGEGARVLVISGPNAGGKTVAMKALALAALFVRAGLQVPCAPGARVDLADAVLADIGDAQNLRESLSTFSAHMAALARIVAGAGPHALVVLDEVGVGTDPGEGAALAQAALEVLADSGARVVATTHYNLLKEMADVDPRFENASVAFDPETLAPTYRLEMGTAGASSALALAARMGVDAAVLDRARALLEREDRQLDRMLAELGASRAALERERGEASRLRAESEEARDRYREKLERLQERRDALFRRMRGELDAAFQDAHAEVAAVIRGLQRGDATARDAARARERLLALRERQRAAEQAVAPQKEEAVAEAPSVDWARARPGDPVVVANGSRGTLLALPDKRGRVAVRAGAARLLVPAASLRTDRDAPASEAKPTRSEDRIRVEGVAADTHSGGSDRCDLRGLRVEEALDRLTVTLDRAARQGRHRVWIVHGIGTGALRQAVREHLRGSGYVTGFGPAEPEEGGEGVTIAALG